MNDQLFYRIADVLFYIFHIGLIFFNLFGWVPRSWRKLNLITLSLTAFSWFILGIFYGFGYCFLTDWHWQVREQLGYTNESNSYIHFLVLKFTGISVDEAVVDICTVACFFAAFVTGIILNLKDKRNRR